MPNSEIEHDSETFRRLKDGGIPGWVLPLDDIDKAPGGIFERMRAEYRDLAPPLLALFESDLDAMSVDDSDHLNYALFFAAEFKDERFSDALLRALRVEDDLLEFLFGDFLTTAMDECIARICWRDLEGIKSLALDPRADRFARWTALDSFKRLLADDYYPEERLKAELRDVVQRLEDKVLWDAITSVVTSLGWSEFEKDVIEAHEAEHVDRALFGDSDAIRNAIRQNVDQSANDNAEVFDAVIILENYWQWSKDIAAEIAEAEDMRRIGGGDESWDRDRAAARIETPEGYILDEGGGLMRDAKKVGRNDPCSCGSGKKFKKCCG